MFEKKFMEMIYQKAEKTENLLWHSEKPSTYLTEAIEQRNAPGNALDLGCGAGVFSIYLAKQQYKVTGLDFIPRALTMAALLAEKENVNVNWVEADLLTWETSDTFDIVLDSGCLHTVGSSNMEKYKQQLLSWTKAGSDLILGHFGKSNFFDWRPVGPHRRTRQQLVEFLAPEFTELKYEQEIQAGVPLPIGPSVILQSIWLRRK